MREDSRAAKVPGSCYRQPYRPQAAVVELHACKLLARAALRFIFGPAGRQEQSIRAASARVSAISAAQRGSIARSPPVTARRHDAGRHAFGKDNMLPVPLLLSAHAHVHSPRCRPGEHRNKQLCTRSTARSNALPAIGCAVGVYDAQPHQAGQGSASGYDDGGCWTPSSRLPSSGRPRGRSGVRQVAWSNV